MPPAPGGIIKSVGSQSPEKANPLAARPEYRKAGTQSYGSLLADLKETAGPPNGQRATFLNAPFFLLPGRENPIRRTHWLQGRE